MIVVDTNVIASMFLSTDRSDAVEQAYRIDPDWRVPLLWRSEFRNVLSTSMRLKRLSLEDAVEIMAEALRLLHGREYDVASDEVLALAVRSGCSAYDCEFIALAGILNVPLLTEDRAILERFPGESLSLRDFLASAG